jgi:homoserine dehydrogenase
LYKVKNGENALAFYSRYYQPIPLVLRGYGAGNDVRSAASTDTQSPSSEPSTGETAAPSTSKPTLTLPIEFYSRYYQPIPLVLRGYGAGNDVTAAGVFADLLRTLTWG